MSWDKYYYEKIYKKTVSDYEIQRYFHNTMNDGKINFMGKLF